LRKLAATALAIPVLAFLTLSVVLRHSPFARIGFAVGITALVGLGVLAFARPADTTATLPAPPIVPLTTAAFTSAADTNVALGAPVTLRFSAAMNPDSVAAALEVEPRTGVQLVWNPDATALTVSPRTGWSPGSLHTVTVRAGALAQTGRPTSRAARAAFVTRPATEAKLTLTRLTRGQTRLDSAFRIAFDHAVDPMSVRAGFMISPPIEGSWRVVQPATATSILAMLDARSGRDEPGTTLEFVPVSPLAAGTSYHVTLADVADADGAPVATDLSLVLKTIDAPRVVRFRPASRESGVAPDAALSVRFSTPMDHASTKAAFSASIAGGSLAGSVSFAENDTVLVFRPSAPMPYGAAVKLQVNAGAKSIAGASIPTANSVTFSVRAAPVQARTTSRPRATSTTRSSGAAVVGSATWSAVERYYLGLMNCTRTGGWVDSGGHCDSPGGRNVAALRLDAGISSKVSRPYARRLAVNNQCSHFIGGNPGDRLRAAGYTSYRWAENLGCRSGNPYSAVLASHLFFQSERSYNGGHYRNLMDARFDRCGIGVWVSGGRVRLVIDFYHP
jgi:uncharacterized protein YkwD